MDAYTQHGFKGRDDYLRHLASDYGMPFKTIYAIACVLGPQEDFDGLVNKLEDIIDYNHLLRGNDE